VSLTVCGGHTAEVCRRERLRVLTGVSPLPPRLLILTTGLPEESGAARRLTLTTS